MRIKGNLGAIANVLVIGLVGYVLVRPVGPVGSAITRWRNDAAVRALIVERWTEISQAPRLDTSDAQVAIVEFSDYECPVCKIQHKMLQQVSNDPRVGGLAFRHLPLPNHPRAADAARAAICAEQQGRFRQFHDRLFSSDGWISTADWSSEALRAGVPDLAAFNACLTSDETSSRLQKDIALATALRIRGTPAYVHREGVISGSIADSVFLRIAARTQQ